MLSSYWLIVAARLPSSVIRGQSGKRLLSAGVDCWTVTSTFTLYSLQHVQMWHFTHCRWWLKQISWSQTTWWHIAFLPQCRAVKLLVGWCNSADEAVKAAWCCGGSTCRDTLTCSQIHLHVCWGKTWLWLWCDAIMVCVLWRISRRGDKQTRCHALRTCG